MLLMEENCGGRIPFYTLRQKLEGMDQKHAAKMDVTGRDISWRVVCSQGNL
jgi:hypothetical protein